MKTSRRAVLESMVVTAAVGSASGQEAPSKEGGQANQKPFHLAPGESRRGSALLLRGKDPFSNKLSTADTNGRSAIFETTTSPGEGPALHKHHSQDEWWYVLDGEFVFQLGGEKFRAKPGATVFGPRGIPHSFLSVGKVPGRLIIVFEPAGEIEAFFLEASRVTSRPRRAPGTVSHGIEAVGPRVTEIP